jgi:hypothetical protein
MANHLIDRWKQKGAAYLWRYATQRRNFPGWNFTADAVGCQSLIELIDLMLSNEWSATQTIRLHQPTDSIASLPGLDGSWHAANILSLKYPSAKAPAALWECSDGRDPVLTVGRDKLIDLRSAMMSVSQNIGDFCLHSEEQPAQGTDTKHLAIWFW